MNITGPCRGRRRDGWVVEIEIRPEGHWYPYRYSHDGKNYGIAKNGQYDLHGPDSEYDIIEIVTKTPVRSAQDAITLAITGDDAGRRAIAEQGLQLVGTLLAKNKDYGCSAWESPLLCPEMTARQALLCRMSDKVKRLQNLLSGNDPQVDESIEDTLRDLAGYCLLELARPKGEADANHDS